MVVWREHEEDDVLNQTCNKGEKGSAGTRGG